MKKGRAEHSHLLWCLYSRTSHEQLRALSLNEMRAIYAALKPSERTEWLAWREGWSEWQPLASCEKPLAEKPKSKRELRTTPPLPQISRVSEKEVLVQKEEKKILPRRAYRHPRRCLVEVICNNRSFESYSKDISLGGVQLESSMPEWIAGYCTLIIHDGETRLEFLATIVENQLVDNRTRLEIQPSENLIALDEWLRKTA